MKTIIPTTIFIVLLLSILAPVKLSAQLMIIHLKDGSTNTYTIQSTSKVTFSSDNLIFDKASNSTPVNTIQKITFGTSTGVKNTRTGYLNLTISPNPVQNSFSIGNLTDGQNTLQIYNPSGVLIYSGQINSSTEKIDISHFVSGLYLVKINSTMLKLIKL